MDRNLFDLPHHAILFALIYKYAVEMYGDEGAQAADQGTMLYGRQRGRRMALRAMADGAELSMENYLLYSEWTDSKNRSVSVVTSRSPVYITENKVCAWLETWKSANLQQYGKNYCRYVDKSLVYGFNPMLQLDITDTLAHGGNSCTFHWHGFAMDNPDSFNEKKASIAHKTIKDFLYHTAHLLNAMTSALTAQLGDDAAHRIVSSALKTFGEMYGEDMAAAITEESKQDFTLV